MRILVLLDFNPGLEGYSSNSDFGEISIWGNRSSTYRSFSEDGKLLYDFYSPKSQKLAARGDESHPRLA